VTQAQMPLLVIAVLLGAVTLYPALHYLRIGSIHVISPVSVLGLSLFLYGVAGLFGAVADPDSLVIGAEGAEYLPFATAIFFLGFVAFAVGHGRPPRLVPPPRTLPEWKENRILPVVLILAGLAWSARIFAASQGLVFGKLMSDDLGSIPAIELLGAQPIVLTLMQGTQALTTAAILVCLVTLLRVHRDAPPRRRRTWMAIAIALAAAEIAYFATVGLSRMAILTVGASMFCLVSALRRPPVKQAFILTAVFVLWVMPFTQIVKATTGSSGATRASGDLLSITEQIGVSAFEAIDLLGADYFQTWFDSLGHSTRATGSDLIVVALEGQLRDGRSPIGLGPLLTTFLNLIPRLVWPDKPIAFASGREIQNYYGYGFREEGYADAVVTPVAQLYAYVGLLGVVLGMWLLGLLAGLMYRKLVVDPGAAWNTGLVLYAVMAFGMFFPEIALAGILARAREGVLLGLFLIVVLEGRVPFAAAPQPARAAIVASGAGGQR
jgi:hypothetical protein